MELSQTLAAGLNGGMFTLTVTHKIIWKGGENQMAEKKEVVGKAEGIVVIILAVVAFVLGLLAQ